MILLLKTFASYGEGSHWIEEVTYQFKLLQE